MPNFLRLVNVSKRLKSVKQTGRSFHVAFLLKGRKVVEIGFNHFGKTGRICSSYTKPTRPHGDGYIPNLHAEIDVISKVKRNPRANKMTLVSIRINNNGELAWAQPCPNCAYILGKKGFDNIFFSTSCGNFAKMGGVK